MKSFSFRILKAWLHCLLTSSVTIEKPYSDTWSCVCGLLFLSLETCGILSWFLGFRIFLMIGLGIGLESLRCCVLSRQFQCWCWCAVVLGIFLKLFCRWFHLLYFYSLFLLGFPLLVYWVSCACLLILLFFVSFLSFCSTFWDISLNLSTEFLISDYLIFNI